MAIGLHPHLYQWFPPPPEPWVLGPWAFQILPNIIFLISIIVVVLLLLIIIIIILILILILIIVIIIIITIIILSLIHI